MTAEDFQTSLRMERHEDEAARQRQIDAHDRALADEHEAGRAVIALLRAQQEALARIGLPSEFDPAFIAWADAWEATELAT